MKAGQALPTISRSMCTLQLILESWGAGSSCVVETRSTGRDPERRQCASSVDVPLVKKASSIMHVTNIQRATPMAVFLVQVSGGESTHKKTGVKSWWQEPIEKGVYINYDWRTRPRGVGDTWKRIQEGDRLLIYCTADVQSFSQMVSHVFTVKKVELSDEKAVAYLADKIELKLGMPLDIIREKTESGELSEGMAMCGGQGFNIRQVEDSDLDVIMKWSESGMAKQSIEVSRESDLRRYLTEHPERIERGMTLVSDFQEILPEGAGIPDLICRDEKGKYVAVELKAGQAEYDALGQVVSYKGAIISKTKSNVRGIIVASGFDDKIRFGAQIIDSQGLRLAELKKYSMNFDLEDV